MAEPQLDSNVLWPSMMQKTRLLILDYDVTRYHSFDLFRYLLWSDREMFKQCDPMYIPFIKETDLSAQIQFYVHNCGNINPFDNFTHMRGNVDRNELERHLQLMFADKSAKITPTDISGQYEVVFQRPGISGYLLRYKNESHKPAFYQDVTVYESEHLLDLRMAFAIIQKHNINAVLVSSADLALILARKLIAAGNTSPISFIIGAYCYNYDPEKRMMRNMGQMDEIELRYKHEFGIFDPFSSLTYKRKFEGAGTSEQQ